MRGEEVLTPGACGEYSKAGNDKGRYGYFAQHGRHFFPGLKDRTGLTRRAANLWRLRAALQRRLAQVSGRAEDPVRATDTLPLPVCTDARAPRDKRFKELADCGHCAAKKPAYDGSKPGLRLSRAGVITHCPSPAARPHDVTHLGLCSKASAVWCRLIKGSSASISTDSGEHGGGCKS